MESVDAPDRADQAGPVLVVEDDPDLRRYIQQALEEDGLPVVAVADGWQALGAVIRGRPALAVLDLMLPRLDGSDVADALRLAHDAEVPVLLITGRHDAAEYARRLGAVAYLRKPFELADLIAEVRRALGRP